MLLFPL